MNIIQKKLLNLGETRDLSKMSYRQIGRLIGLEFAQQVKYHLEQLRDKEYIKLDRDNGIFEILKKDDASSNSGLIPIPVLGSADCGPETKFADEYVHGYIRVSKNIISNNEGLFAIEADGFSMNEARVGKMKKNIEPGDYVIVDGNVKTPNDNDYVLSVIDGLANIKKFHLDRDHRQVVLISESTKKYPPIVIDESEIDQYVVSGKIVEVIKKPKIKN